MTTAASVALGSSTATRRPMARGQVRRVGTVFLRLRPWFVAPAIVASWVFVLPVVPASQGAVLAGVSGTMLVFFTVEAVFARRREVDERWLRSSLLVTVLGLLVACVGTGGVASPFVPLLFAPTVTAFAAFGRDRNSALALAILVLGIAALVALPADRPFPPLPGAVRGLMTACTVILAGALLRVSVAGLSDAHEDAGRDLDRLRADLLQGMSERAAEVESIGAKVAHEIRNPLTAIRGLVDLLATDATEAKAIRRFDVVRAEILRVESILRDYLSFARPLSELQRTAVVLPELVARIADILDARAHAAGVSLALGVGAEPVVIAADGGRLTEALLNLVGNAIEACDRGGVVHLRLGTEGADVVLDIVDDGRGMTPELLARIGTPYVSARPGGTGLGVVLARQVIEQHGGTLAYRSEVDRGTTATVRLPLGGPA